MIILVDVYEAFTSGSAVIPYPLLLVAITILIRDNYISPVFTLVKYLLDSCFVLETESFKHAIFHEAIELPSQMTNIVCYGIIVVESP